MTISRKPLTEEPPPPPAVAGDEQERDTPKGGVYVNTPDMQYTRPATATPKTHTGTQEQTPPQGSVYVNTPHDHLSANSVSALQILQQYADGLKLLVTAADAFASHHADALLIVDEIERTLALLRRVLHE